jgi:hypothetical protein
LILAKPIKTMIIGDLIVELAQVRLIDTKRRLYRKETMQHWEKLFNT